MVRGGVQGEGGGGGGDRRWRLRPPGCIFFSPTSQDDIAHAILYVILYLSPINGT